MVAVFIFGHGHPAIDYLILLAVVDDGLGLIIIAVFILTDRSVQPTGLCFA